MKFASFGINTFEKLYLVVLRSPFVKTRLGGSSVASCSVSTGAPVVLPSSISPTVTSSAFLFSSVLSSTLRLPSLLSSPCRASPKLNSKARERRRSSLILHLLFLTRFSLVCTLFTTVVVFFFQETIRPDSAPPPSSSQGPHPLLTFPLASFHSLHFFASPPFFTLSVSTFSHCLVTSLALIFLPVPLRTCPFSEDFSVSSSPVAWFPTAVAHLLEFPPRPLRFRSASLQKVANQFHSHLNSLPNETSTSYFPFSVASPLLPTPSPQPARSVFLPVKLPGFL